MAKEQGLRSRAAFKLTQINRRYPLLEKCNSAVLDLCAAPGGWTQIAARTCPKTTAIVAVDVLPIRTLKHPNVTTLIGDITTDKCKADIDRAVGNRVVDVVLHDGAPNVGAEYGKDAYEQNELALHAVRCAVKHLRKGGAFVTKMYRSRDYAAFVWTLKQLFDNVSALKPKASRAQSAEIFLIAEGYKAPAKLDPRFLDPKHVFASVEGDTTGGTMGGQQVDIFHKNFGVKKRHRTGYDHEHLDFSMRHVETIAGFVAASMKEAIEMLSKSTGLKFECEECQEQTPESSCNCRFFLHHPLTTDEIKECVADLQVLNKSDFKSLLSWRTKMQDAVEAKKGGSADPEMKDGSRETEAEEASDNDADEDSDKEEAEIQAEILAMRERRQRERKRQKKKERAAAAKRRRQAALGMDLNAIDVPEHDKIFSLATITSKGALDAAAEVNLDEVTDEQIFGHDSDSDVVVGEGSDDESIEEEARLRRRERDLDEAYNMYLASTKNGLAKSGTKMAKRSKKLQRLKVAEEAAEDQEMALSAPSAIGQDMKTYAKMLQGGNDSDDDDDDASSSDEDDDGFDAEPVTPEEHGQMQKRKKQKTEDSNPLIHQFADVSASAKTARWFSNPLFATIGEAAQSAVMKKGKTAKEMESDEDLDDDSDTSSLASDSDKNDKAQSKRKVGLDADEVLASIPKTDKQVRHERRLKAMAREERRKARKAKRLGEAEEEFELVPAEEEKETNELDKELEHLSEAERKKVRVARELIKAGMGKALVDDLETEMEIVPQNEMSRPQPIKDTRKYDSDHEAYDSDDYAQTLALGTMVLRRSKEKALVDASYNRYAWNDPEDLPEWFVDDENKHYRPQLPIPPALLAKMKEKMMALSAKPIAKVAEARARKSKRARDKLAAAKKQAEAVANSSDMSEAMKLKAISKALRGQDSKKPGKTYVVAKKGRTNKGGKGMVVVDKRMKCDKRAMKRAEKRKGKRR